MGKLQELRSELKKFARPERAKVLQRFFKTGSGEYGEGDVFLGLKTDETRRVAMRYLELPLSEAKKLLASQAHEERTVTLMILSRRFAKGDLAAKREIHQFYLENLAGINNWDLVDTSAPAIVGEYLNLAKAPRPLLYKLARSQNIWHRRISIMATFPFLKQGDFNDTFKIAELLLSDKEDLIHKAVGWMLREVGKVDTNAEEEFLKKHAAKMPRTMLRYAIERFPEEKRLKYLKNSATTKRSADSS